MKTGANRERRSSEPMAAAAPPASQRPRATDAPSNGNPRLLAQRRVFSALFGDGGAGEAPVAQPRPDVTLSAGRFAARAAPAPTLPVLQLQAGRKLKVGDLVVRANDGSNWRVTATWGNGAGKRYRVRRQGQPPNPQQDITPWSPDWLSNVVGTDYEDPTWDACTAALNNDQPDPVSSRSADTNGQQPWDWTVTYQFAIDPGDGAGVRQVRAHVHYTRNGLAGWTKGPGNMWISGLEAHAGGTAQWIVDAAPDQAPAQRGEGVGWALP